MTTLLEKALSELKKLPEKEQNNFAQLIMDELKWDSTFLETQNKLSMMAKEALAEYKSGKAENIY